MTTKAAPVLELTIRAAILGLILSVVMGAANVYLGLKAGMTVSASIPAAVVAMLILRGVFRSGTILEANQVQTAASAGESLAAGIIFTMPALILIGAWTHFDMWTTTLIAFSGGLLGILFMIPMRRVFILDNKELKYPEGVACAAVLRAGESNEEKAAEGEDAASAAPVVRGGLLGVAFKALVSFVGVFKHTLETATAAGSRIFYFGGDVSPALVGVGLIVRLNVAILIFIGGAMGWLIGIPAIGGEVGSDGPVEAAWDIWSKEIRYVGVGAMVVGGMASIVKVRHGLVSAVTELSKRFKKKQSEQPEDHTRDISTRVIVTLTLLAVAIVFGLYFSMTGGLAIAGITTVLMIVLSFFFTAVASYIVGLVGNSNSPVSGMTITAVLFTGVLLFVFGFSGKEGMVATLGVAAIVCCTACTSGDVCNDLKTGHMVGAAPYRQQTMQVMGVAIASLVMAPVMQLLHDNTPGGIGGKELSAPQASLFASLARGFFGDGQLPWNLVGIGAAVGVAVLIVDRVLEAKKATFRAHLMPIAVGMYLPFGLSVPILIGGIMAHFIGKGAKSEAEEDRWMRPGVLFASGIIAGESLTGVGIAILAAIGIQRLNLGLPGGVVTIATMAGCIGMIAVFWMSSRRRA